MSLLWRRAYQGFDYALMVINATAYFGISYGLMWADLRDWMGGFSLLLALFYDGLAYIALRRGVETVRLALFALGIALVLLTIAIPIQLGDKAWTLASGRAVQSAQNLSLTALWTVYAVILLVIGIARRWPKSFDKLSSEWNNYNEFN